MNYNYDYKNHRGHWVQKAPSAAKISLPSRPQNGYKQTPNMKTTGKITLLSLACATVITSASAETPSPKQLQSYPKNLARQHHATNLFLYDATSKHYVATEAAAAWMDDDVTTGWPALAGKQYYMLQLAEPQMLTNFSLSTKPGTGTVSLYVSNTEAAPGDAAWQPVETQLALTALNNKRLSKGINKTAKYVLIETNIADPGPIYSIYLYGEKSAASVSIVPRSQTADVRSLVGEFTNNQTAFSVSSLYANARVSYASGQGGSTTWQRAIDDNPETSTPVPATAKESGMIVKFSEPRSVSRLSILADQNARGKAEIYLLSQAPEGPQPVSVDGLSPSLTLTFDGSTARSSADFAETSASAMAIVWKPESGEASLNLREINTFADLSLASYEVTDSIANLASNPTEPSATKKGEPTSENSTGDGTPIVQSNSDGKDGKAIAAIGEGSSGKDGKALAPVGAGPSGKDGKSLAPVGEGPAPVGAGPGFSPGRLAFPPRTPRNPLSPP